MSATRCLKLAFLSLSGPLLGLSGLWVLPSLGLVFGSGCGGDEAGVKCVDQVCVAGEAAVCVGQEVRTCASDGEAYAYAMCSSQQRCEGGACLPKQCTTIGEATCATPTSVRRCADDGSKFETFSCGTGETCRDGACAPTSCTTDPDRCTTNGYLRCASGSWTQSTCPASEVCSIDEASGTTARCLPTRCTPWATRCDGDVAKTCDSRGASEAEKVCGDDEVCRQGQCQARVCGDSTPTDTVSDTSDVSDTNEPTSQLIFTLDGVAIAFDQNSYADFGGGPRRLTIRASRSTSFLEIQLQPSNAIVSGSYSSEVVNPVRVIACYKGTGIVGDFDDCPEGTTHRSTAYAINVTRNDGAGGRVEGTFSLTLEDKNTDAIVLGNGQINVRYR